MNHFVRLFNLQIKQEKKRFIFSRKDISISKATASKHSQS